MSSPVPSSPTSPSTESSQLLRSNSPEKLSNYRPKSPSELSDYEDTADRIASLKDRLKSISVKHTPKRASIQGSMSQTDVSSAEAPPTRSPTPPAVSSTELVQTPLSSARSSLADVSVISSTPNYKQPDPDCYCQKVVGDTTESSTCKLCLGGLKPIIDLQSARDKLLHDLDKARQRHVVFTKREDETIKEMSRLRDLLEEKELLLSKKNAELETTKVDLHSMGEKLMDAIEARAELQASKEAVQDELEDLTKQLFEEANNLVAKEARIRREHERREISLAKQLETTSHQLAMEQEQLKELRLKLANQQSTQSDSESNVTQVEYPEGYVKVDVNSNAPDMLIQLQDAIDPLLLAEFETFLQQASSVKLSKLHSVPFMKNSLEDDLEPCLRFGGNSKVSTTKLIDAIARNSCFVEELSATQIAAMEAARNGTFTPNVQIPILPYDYQVKRDSSSDSMDPWGPKPPPTFSLFNKTVIERITRWGGMSSTPQVPAQTASNPGCSTCGRSGLCRYQFRVSDQTDDIWCPICSHCRDRLVAVCEFYNFVRHVRQGLYASRIVGELFVEVMALKRKMFYARIGCAHPTMFNERGWAKIKSVHPAPVAIVPSSISSSSLNDIPAVSESEKKE